MTTVLSFPEAGQSLFARTKSFISGGLPIDNVTMACESMPQNVLATDFATVLMNNEEKSVLPVLSEKNLEKTLSNKLESLTISGRRLSRQFARRFSKQNMAKLNCLVLTGDALHADTRGSRLMLSHLPTSLQHLTLSWNDLSAESADVLARRIIFMKQLRSICLAGNPIGVKGMQKLIDLGNLHHVEEIDVRDCDLGASGAAMLAKIMSHEDARTKHIVLDMNLLAAFSRALDKSKVQMKVQIDLEEKVVMLRMKRA